MNIRIILAMSSLIFLSGCQAYSDFVDPIGYHYHQDNRSSFSSSVVNTENQLRVVVSRGSLAFYGKDSQYWPESFYISEGETKFIRFYQKLNRLKHENTNIDVAVSYLAGQLIFDSHLTHPKVQNWGIWLSVEHTPYTRKCQLSIGKQFSRSNAKNLCLELYTKHSQKF